MLHYFQPFWYAVANAAFEILSVMIMYYFTAWFLFPRYYGKNKFYLLISMAIVMVFSFLFLTADHYLIPEYEFIEHKKPPVFFIFLRHFTTLGFAYFVSTSISLMERNAQLKQNETNLMEEKLETELKLLKAQINPHFIFNALNNIYSLAYMKSKNAPDSILKLSEMLRYVFYDCSKDRVPLSSELGYIENFISFQQMKSEHVQDISLDVEPISVEIAPMLLIPFIENAFKYSRIEELEDAYVKMKIDMQDTRLHFSIENSIPESNKTSAGSGMGIKNVEHRLKIIYPNRSQLNIDEQATVFKVDLTIEV
jgi:LytS/YehU family sensor histidine kinase